MPLSTNQSYFGLAKETTRGTGVAAATFLPIRSQTLHDAFTYLEDNATRGSMVPTYNLIQGVVYGEYDFSGDVFPDTVGHFGLGLLGNSPTPTTGAVFDVSTTNSSTTITSNTANFAASDVGKGITGTGIPGATTIASVTTATTAVLSAAATATGTPSATIARTSTFSHIQSLLNNAGSTGNQPPSYSLSDTDGINTHRITAGQFAEFTMSFSADGLLSYSAKAMGNKSAIPSDPTPSFSTVLPEAGWNGQIVIAGALSTKLEDGTISIKRTVNPVYTLANAQNPYRLWAGDLTVDGNFTFIVDDDTELNYYLNNTQPAVTVLFTQPSTQYVVAVQMSKCAFSDASMQRGKEWLEAGATYRAMPNTTDATATGYSPCKMTVINGQSTAY